MSGYPVELERRVQRPCDPECTSFEDIYSGTIEGVIMLQGASECALRVTGGTEAGHLPGPYSREAGYKVDIALGDCVGDYIRSNFRGAPTRIRHRGLPLARG